MKSLLFLYLGYLLGIIVMGITSIDPSLGSSDKYLSDSVNITLPYGPDVPLLEQPSDQVDSILLFTDSSVHMVIYRWPCRDSMRMWLYQLRYTRTGKWYRYQFYDSCQ